MDGIFTIPENVRQVEFSYIGFKPLKINVIKSSDMNWIVNLFPDGHVLSMAGALPGKNPANRIMQSVLNHAEANNPDKLESYQYTSYNKFWLSADPPSENKLGGRKKISASELHKLQQRFESNHMLLVETLSKKKFLRPKHENEEILSSKISGLKKDAFFLLSNELQSFSIYDENFSVLGKTYLSPISKSAMRNYAFILEDTLQIDNQDTTFLIRFHPAKDRNFDGLKGFLHINTNGYAVQSVFAEQAGSDKNEISASVWQNWNRPDSIHWFPFEKNAAVNFKILTSIPLDSLTIKRKPFELSVTANSRTYLYQTTLNTPLDPKSFPKYGVTLSAEEKETAFDSKGFRHIPLTTKDSTTYQYLDSLQKIAKQTRQIKLVHALSLGTIPLGVVSINYTYLFGYTINEGYKVGPGIETNRKFSKYFATGANFIFSTRNGEFRHGEWLKIYPTGYADFKIQLGYRDVKRDYGEEEMLTEYNIFEPEYFRSLLIKNMYQTKNFTASIELRPIEPLNFRLFVDHAYNSRNSYGNFSAQQWEPFQLSKLGLMIRYSPGIAFLNDTEELIQSAPPKSEFYFSVIQGLRLFSSQFHFTKIDTKAKFSIRLSALGTTAVMVRAGKIFDTSPITDWFHGYGSNSGSFTLLPHYAFATMGLNEFSADQYAALHIRHNFGKGFIPSYYFIRPELVLAQNIGIGYLPGKYTAASGATDFRNGYYESGIELNKILNSDFVGLGFGTYYRYGPYRLTNKTQNLAYKLTINFKF
jgi:hypothetical protein